jgi:hypothetical protein
VAAHPARRRLIGTALVVLLALGAGAGALAAVTGGHAVTPVATTTPRATAAPGPPAAADVAAARACQAFTVYLSDASAGVVPRVAGESLVDDADALLAGASGNGAATKPLPKWSQLGANLLSAAKDVVDHDSSALATDGAAAAQECQTVPAAAAVAGGYVRSPG